MNDLGSNLSCVTLEVLTAHAACLSFPTATVEEMMTSQGSEDETRRFRQMFGTELSTQRALSVLAVVSTASVNSREGIPALVFHRNQEHGASAMTSTGQSPPRPLRKGAKQREREGKTEELRMREKGGRNLTFLAQPLDLWLGLPAGTHTVQSGRRKPHVAPGHSKCDCLKGTV